MRETELRGGNKPCYAICKHCGEYKEHCTCWCDFMDKLDRIIAIKTKKDIFTFLKVKSIWKRIIDIIRRTPTSISGMKGVKLLKRLDKK